VGDQPRDGRIRTRNHRRVTPKRGSINRYRTTINIAQAQIDSTHDILDLARQHGEASIEDGANLVVTFEVGGREGIPDLWDLREVIEELQSNLSSYFDCTIPKPEPVA
jgi:hypothetical protein